MGNIVTPDFQNAFDLFALGLQKWGKTIGTVPQIKILFFDNADDCVGVVSFEPDEDPEDLVSCKGASSFAVLENHLDENDYIVTKTEISAAQTACARTFKKAGEQNGLAFKDYLLISPDGFYSAGENGLTL